MKQEDILPSLDYHYRRVTVGTVEQGKGEVQAKIHVPGSGWYIHLQDTRTLRIKKLRPAHVLKRVLVRRPKA